MGNQTPPYQSEERLRTLYCDEELTIRAIAKRFGISTATVHYWMKKHDIERRYSGTLRERFNQYHEKDANEEGCWLWQNKPDEWGYGTIMDGDRTRRAHRVAFDLFREEKLPEFSPDEQINHTCHNPACVNPDHLYLGTAKENSQDAVKADAWGDNRKRGSEVETSKLTEEQVREIKQRCQNGETQKDVSQDYPISHAMVNKIMVGKWWQHVTVGGSDE
jgi:transposase